MSEVTEFLSANPDMGSAFREFAARYSSLAEVWDNCPRSDWMLWILYKRKYRNTERLGKYVEWLREQLQQHDDETAGERRLSQLDAFKRWIERQVEEDLQAKRITQNEASYRHFLSVWDMALQVSYLLLAEKITDSKLDSLYERYKFASAGQELHIPDIDEATVRVAGLKEQAEKLRELVGNPFVPARVEDFYYGRGQF